MPHPYINLLLPLFVCVCEFGHACDTS